MKLFSNSDGDPDGVDPLHIFGLLLAGIFCVAVLAVALTVLNGILSELWKLAVSSWH